ncbi:hypothetical protein IWX50DRAFT_648755 [Phyllosticta citricarpa]
MQQRRLADMAWRLFFLVFNLPCLGRWERGLEEVTRREGEATSKYRARMQGQGAAGQDGAAVCLSAKKFQSRSAKGQSSATCCRRLTVSSGGQPVWETMACRQQQLMAGLGDRHQYFRTVALQNL